MSKAGCQNHFWRILNPEDMKGSLLWEGGTAATLNGQENVYCIVVQHTNADIVNKVRDALSQSTAFKEVCSKSMFVEDSRCRSEPLPDAGNVDSTGTLIGNAWNARTALGSVKKEKQKSDDTTQNPTKTPERTKPASERTNNLPQIDSFEDLRKLIKKVFIPGDTDFSLVYWMTPEELCDIVEHYAHLLEVQFSEYSCSSSEDMCCVRLFQKKPSEGSPIELTGLFAFPSEADAKRFIEEWKSVVLTT